MKQEKNGKILYHVQSATDWQEEPFDLFIYAKDEKTISDNLKQLYIDDTGLNEIDNSDELTDLIENTNIYTIYAEEI